MASPMRDDVHSEPHARLMGWLARYSWSTPGVRLSDNATVRLDLHNEPQPDALLRIESGGQSRRDEDDTSRALPNLWRK